MKKFNRIVPLFSVIILCCSASTAWPQSPQQNPVRAPLIAAGSGVNLGIMRLLARAFMNSNPQVIIEVPGSIGSKGAIKAAADGAITIGLISRSLQEDEKSLGLVARPYARVPIVVGVHPSVEDNEVTFQELADIYRGAKTRWKDGNEIIVLSREPFDSGVQVLEKEVPGFKEAYRESQQAKRWAVQFTDQDANRAISMTRYAIGFSDLGMIATEGLAIKVMKLNGIVPNPENLLNGQYPLKRDLSFLYRDGFLPEGAKAFLEFVRSEEGEKILRSHGYLPLK